MYIKKSYDDHEDHIKKVFNKELEERLKPYYSSDKDNKHIFEPFFVLKPFLQTKSNWLTIGDYLGLEANYLNKRNQDCTASDISDSFLGEVHKRGFITNYAKVNAEAIPFDDNSFDYVVSKEMLHHLPRPYQAINEMIRVCKKAVIATCEPVDILSKMPSLLLIKNILDNIDPLLINKIWKNRFSYENFFEQRAINYVYKFSEREIEKLAAAIKLPMVAFYFINYKMSKMYDLLTRFKIFPKGQMSFIIFKEFPDANILEQIKKMRFKIIQLPEQ